MYESRNVETSNERKQVMKGQRFNIPYRYFKNKADQSMLTLDTKIHKGRQIDVI